MVECRVYSRLVIIVTTMLVLGSASLCRATEGPAAEARRTLSLDQGWRFHLGDVTGAEKPEMADTDWRTLDVPHDFSIEGPPGIDPATMDGPFDRKSPGGTGAGALNGGIAWYRKTFALPEDARGKRVCVLFDGVYMDSDVWLNGVHLGKQSYGYSSFQYDLTPQMKPGTNVLAVRVHVQQPCSRWYSGAGIYRHVWLTITDPVHVALWGTCVTTPEVLDTAAQVRVRTRVQNDGANGVDATLTTTIIDAGGKKVAEHQAAGQIAANSSDEFDQTLEVETPRRWSVHDPHMYRAVSEVRVGGRLADRYETTFGIRTIEFTADKGFLLNGQRLQIKGVCNHHDLGCLGSAVHRRAIERQLEILKAMGCNAIRTSHNPPAPELLDLCDRMGLVVMDEAFDEWIIPKSGMRYGYGRFFEEWSERDLVRMIHRDRNHPCVILWSIGNEIKEQAAPQGGAMALRLADIVHREDPTRPVTSGVNKMEPATKNGFTKALDVIGLNYFVGEYQNQRGKWLVAAETSSALSTRGEYGLELKSDGNVVINKRANNQCVSYDLDRPGWGCTAEASLLAVKNAPWIAGEFVWTGFDYIGEPTPYGWPSRSSYFGIIDLAGFPKDRYYLYQSQWTNEPVIHLLPHWNWKGFEGKDIPVWCFTNAESVELFINGKSLGSKDFRDTKSLHLEWEVPYEPGVLRAVGKKAGQTIVDEMRTAGEPARLIVRPDRRQMAADGEDLSYVEVRIVDKDGTLCPNADNQIAFSIEGPGAIAGVDNGDPTSHEPFKATKHKAFHGLCLAVVKAVRTPGEIRLSATAQGLQSEPVTISATAKPAMGVTVDTDATIQALRSGWDKPARTYKPHTRWWWPGNALTQVDITWQLEQMAAQGIGGVEIMNMWKVYEKGNVEYLTPEFLDLVKHTVVEAKRLDIEVAITFSPGWGFGGSWVPQDDQSKVLCLASKDLEGGARFSGSLPLPDLKGVREPPKPGPPGTVVAVVAGRITGKGQLDGESLTVLTSRVKPAEAALEWDIPPGQWRLMVFWLEFSGQECSAQSFQPPAMVIDHLNRGAVQRYCEHLGGALEAAVGGEFGRTVDSFFCDSFEFWPLSNAMLWSTDTLAGFERYAGYDFARYLPAIWFNIGPLTPRVRYDLGDYLNHLGLETFFQPFNEWCDAHYVQARIQPHYRFTEELVQGAGSTARPETEVTTARFEPVADPRKATVSGARFYGREIVSAEAYTFIHPARYRTNLQDLKIATDAFLRDGITQFYNHGYFGSPEPHVAPTRDFPWANRIGHWNTWWKYYHHVAEYVARGCFLLRQGRFVADVLIYSPQATTWSERALWGSTRRVMPYGNLAKTLVANGYDFDIVNDDLLQHRAAFRNGRIEVNGYAYRVLILPRATVVPIATMRAIRDFVQAGGTVVALDELPAAAAGLRNYQESDRELKQITDSLFSTDPARQSGGIFLPEYKMGRTSFNPGRQPSAPTPPLNAAQRRLLGILARLSAPDFVMAGRAQSDGLTFIHKRVDDVDVYFVCNLQPQRIATDVTFRVSGKTPQRWDAVTGTVETVAEFRSEADGTTLGLEFEPWESAFFVFYPGIQPKEPVKSERIVKALPEPLAVTGTWNMRLEGYGFETLETTCDTLISWTEAPRTRHFSGTGRYEIGFTVPADRLTEGARVWLDLGQVGTIAEVEINGQAVGVAWMSPYRLDITGAVRAGNNRLVVFVTNTLINYVSGLREPPDVPPDLQPRLGKANPAIYPEGRSAQREMSETDLPPSGLMGPVQVVFRRHRG